MKTIKPNLVRQALELVRDGLRGGAIPAENFDMGNCRRPRNISCGTALCIGGWAREALALAGALHPKTGLGELVDTIDDGVFGPTEKLFFCWSPLDPTPAQGADAIDRYLAGGEPWPDGGRC